MKVLVFKLLSMIMIGICFTWVTFVLGFVANEAPSGKYDELPIKAPKGIAVDRHGAIHIYCFDIDRIQVYDQCGKFLYSYNPGLGGAKFKIKYNQTLDEIWIWSYSGGYLAKFDLQGNLIRKIDDSTKQYYNKTDSDNYYCEDLEGNAYVLISSNSTTQKIEKYKNGMVVSELIISMPEKLKWLDYPVDLITGILAILFFIIAKFKEKEYIENDKAKLKSYHNYFEIKDE